VVSALHHFLLSDRNIDYGECDKKVPLFETDSTAGYGYRIIHADTGTGWFGLHETR
jgi:hypothetical protein